MTPEDQVVALFAEANPVPDVDAIDVLDRRLLVDRIEEWSNEMQQTKIRSVDKITAPAQSNRARWSIGVAAAVITAAAVGIGIWLTSGDDTNQPFVDQPPATALDVVLEAFSLSEAGDIEGWQALWSPSATWEVVTPVGVASSGGYFRDEGLFDYPRHAPPSDWNGDGAITISDIDARSIAAFHASGGNWHADCTQDALTLEVVTCRLSPTSVFGTWLQGTNIQLADRSSASGGTATIRIADGQIDNFSLVLDVLDPAGVTAFHEAELEYTTWLRQTDQELANQLTGPSQGQLTINPDTYRQHHELTARWSAQRTAGS